jgi:hypothetical protein
MLSRRVLFCAVVIAANAGCASSSQHSANDLPTDRPARSVPPAGSASIRASAAAVIFHVVVEPGNPGRAIEERASLERRLARANEIYGTAGICFALAAVDLIPEGRARDLITATDRDALASLATPRRKTVEVFVVRSARDLDAKGNIAGVYWRYGGRDRKHLERSYIILSATDSTNDTLAHELGHWLGLPHATSPENLMAQATVRTDTRLTADQIDRVRRSHSTRLRDDDLSCSGN